MLCSSLLLSSFHLVRPEQIDFPTLHPRSCHRYITRTHPGDSLRIHTRTYVRKYDEFDLGPKIPPCSGFTRERAVLFWYESRTRKKEVRRTCVEIFKCFKFIRKIKFPSQIEWAYHFSELHWFKVKWRRKYLVYEICLSLRDTLYNLKYSLCSSSCTWIQTHAKHDETRLQWT